MHELLVRKAEKLMKHDEVLNSEDPAIQTTADFEVEENALHYVRVAANYSSCPSNENAIANLCGRVYHPLLVEGAPCI